MAIDLNKYKKTPVATTTTPVSQIDLNKYKKPEIVPVIPPQKASSQIVGRQKPIGVNIPNVKETFEDIKQTGSNILETLKRGGSKFKEIFTAGQKKEQTPLETGAQYAGQALNTGFGVATDLIKGAAKTALPQSTETYLREKAEGVIKPIAESAPVKQAVDYYGSLSPRAQRNIGAAAEIASILPIGSAPRVVSRTLKTAEKGIEFGAEQAGKALAKRYNPTNIEKDLVENVFTLTKTNAKNYEKIAPKVKPEQELVKRGLAPEVVDGKVDFTKANDVLDAEFDTLNTTLDQAIQRYDKFNVDAGSIVTKANQIIDNDPVLKSLGLREKTKKDIEELLTQYVNDFGRKDFNIPEIQEFKKAQYKQSKVYRKGPTPDYAKADASAILSRVFKDVIEDSVDDVAIKQLNQEIGKIMTTTDYLSKVNGTTVKGGRLGTGLGMITGAGVGAPAGSIGAILGIIGGKGLSLWLQKNAVVGPFKRIYLSRLREGYSNPVLQQTIKYLDDVEKGLKPQVPEAVRKQMFEDYKAGLLTGQDLTRPALPARSSDINVQVGSGRPIQLGPESPSTIEARGRGNATIPTSGMNINPQSTNLLREQNPLYIPPRADNITAPAINTNTAANVITTPQKANAIGLSDTNKPITNNNATNPINKNNNIVDTIPNSDKFVQLPNAKISKNKFEASSPDGTRVFAEYDKFLKSRVLNDLNVSDKGKGLGKELVNQFENWAKKNGTKEAYIKATKDAVGYYQKLGYSVYSAFDDFVLLKKDLK